MIRFEVLNLDQFSYDLNVNNFILIFRIILNTMICLLKNILKAK